MNAPVQTNNTPSKARRCAPRAAPHFPSFGRETSFKAGAVCNAMGSAPIKDGRG